MIQRIQTIFLALAALCGFSLFLEPMDFALVPSAQGGDSLSPMLADGVFDIQDNTGLVALAVFIGLVPLIGIFLFKNRKLQMTIDRLAMVGSIVLLGFGGYLFYQAFEPVQDKIQAVAGFGLAAPILSLVFLMLANRFIKKDEKLVRSADRLR